MKLLKSVVLSVAMLTTSTIAVAQEAKEQYFPLLSYRVGPYGAGGAGFFGGVIDYFNLVNEKGGVNGIKLVWEECETEYNTSRGVECYERLKNLHTGATIVDPMSTGIAYGILERATTDKVPLVTMGYGRSESANGEVFPNVFPLLATYWSAAAAMVEHFANQLGDRDQLKGKKIVLLYHDSAYGKEPWSVLDAESEKLGFELVKVAVAHPGNEQQSQWLQIRQLKPDYVILWGWGVMNTVALRTAQRYGFPREKILGSWWAGSEEDVIPAGDAAKGYTSLALNSPGNYPLLDEIREKIYGSGKGNLSSASSIGSVYHMRGITAAVLWTEAMAAAQKKFGTDKPLTGEQMRWGLENLKITAERQEEIGVSGLFPPFETSCRNHQGAGAVKVQQWDGSKWVALSDDWVVGDQELLNNLVKKASEKYADEHGITPECKS